MVCNFFVSLGSFLPAFAFDIRVKDLVSNSAADPVGVPHFCRNGRDIKTYNLSIS